MDVYDFMRFSLFSGLNRKDAKSAKVLYESGTAAGTDG